MGGDDGCPAPEGVEPSLAEWLGRSEPARRALEHVRLYAPSRFPVVLVGPVGCGRSTLAGELHRVAKRRGRFEPVSSGQHRGDLAHDELFGHEVAAFTGAERVRVGAIEAAAGTLLRDDLAFLADDVQAALLRVLEEGRYTRIGSSTDRAVSARFVFAATAHPNDLMAQSTLLPDFRSRLGEFVERVPSLAERTEEIPELAVAMARTILATRDGSATVTLAEECVELLVRYPWPHNLRELKNVIARAVFHAGVADGRLTIRASHLPPRPHLCGRRRLERRHGAVVARGDRRDAGRRGVESVGGRAAPERAPQHDPPAPGARAASERAHRPTRRGSRALWRRSARSPSGPATCARSRGATRGPTTARCRARRGGRRERNRGHARRCHPSSGRALLLLPTRSVDDDQR